MFKQKTVNTVDKHLAISKDANSLFSATINKLNEADTLIEEDIDLVQQRIDEATEEKNALELIRKNNSNLNAKISKFFGQD